MYALDTIKHELASEISHILKVEVTASDFQTPPQADLGELSLACFSFAKKLEKNPAEIAKTIVEKFPKHAWLSKLVVVGPYCNIFLSEAARISILRNIEKHGANFGTNTSGAKKRLMIEYSNVNTHKEYHIGHVRNISYGDAVNRILTANGWKVIPVSYINDFGIHVAKTLWWLYHEHNSEARKIMSAGIEHKGYFLGQQYARATERLASNDAYKVEVAAVMKAIESRRGDFYKLWKKTRQWSIDQFARVYKELDIHFDAIFYENEFIKAGLKMVEELKKKAVLVQSEGALIANLEKYNLGVLVVLRSDGTALYPVADLPLAIEKIKKYKLDTSLYVVDVRQSLYFNQLFKLLELLGFTTKLEHLTYDFVKLPSGMMSSRSGNIIPYEDLKNMALEKATEEIRKRHTNWTLKQTNAVARAIAFGALKFEMIKVRSDKTITFDINEALRFDGFTAAYLQYTYARIQSIARKAPLSIKRVIVDYARLVDAREKNLIMRLANFPQAVVLAGEKRDPAEIAKYLFELAQLANDYYHAVPVLKAEDSKDAGARLALLESLALIIKQGLNLLGIEVVEEM